MVAGRKKLIYIVTVIVFVIVLINYFFPLQSNLKKQTDTESTNFNTISDDSIGLSFNMSKTFAPIPRQELSAMNPDFSYGFRPAEKGALCILSQTPLKGGGTISAIELRDGILNEVKKVHPDVKLVNTTTSINPIKFGEGYGVLLELSYMEGLAEIKRVEIIAVGKVAQVVAYCQSASTDHAKYYSDFTIFFSSLKIN